MLLHAQTRDRAVEIREIKYLTDVDGLLHIAPKNLLLSVERRVLGAPGDEESECGKSVILRKQVGRASVSICSVGYPTKARHPYCMTMPARADGFASLLCESGGSCPEFMPFVVVDSRKATFEVEFQIPSVGYLTICRWDRAFGIRDEPKRIRSRGTKNVNQRLCACWLSTTEVGGNTSTAA